MACIPMAAAQALESQRWKGAFRHVAFAILNDHNARGAGNFEPFRRVFACLATGCTPMQVVGWAGRTCTTVWE